MIRFAVLAALLALSPGLAHAGPLVGALFTGAFWSTTVGAALLDIGTSLVLGALSNVLQRKRGVKQPGLRTEVSTQGETTPQTIMVGKYATNGHLTAPFMSHSTLASAALPASKIGFGKYRTHIYTLSDMRITALDEIYIDGTKFLLSALGGSSIYGVTPSSGKYAGKFYVKWYDGTQVAADTMLRNAYGNHPERPWTVNHIGIGVAYAIVTFVLDTELWQGEPSCRFVVRGLPLLDPRTATTAYTANAAVILWNLFRGITMPDGNVYGLGVDTAALPSAWWFAAMNACDAVAMPFNAGYEIRVANPGLGGDMPLDVVSILGDACSAEFCDAGGTWLIRVGAVSLPVATVTDDDIYRTKQHSYDPYPAVDETYNAVHAQYPDANNGWNVREAPPLYSSTYEAEDGGQRHIADVSLPAVGSASQVQFLMQAWLKDARRKRQHVEVLPADYGFLFPMDAISRSSVVHNYTSKVFEIGKIVEDPITGALVVHHRERDPSDYGTGGFTPISLNDPAPNVVTLTPDVLQSWSVVAGQVNDASSTARRPALVFGWAATDLLPLDTITVQWRVQGQTTVFEATTANIGALTLTVSEGILPSTSYEARAIINGTRPTTWTSWVSATTGSILLTSADVDVQAEIPFLFQDIEVFETSQAAFQFKKTGPAVVAIMGAGASGSAAAAFGSGTTPTAKIIASGGGAGGLAIKLLNVTSLTDTYVITLGAGGLGVTPPASPTNAVNVTPGNAGGASSFVGPGINMTAGGGQPGQGAGTVNSSAARSVSGGLGGTAIGGDLNYTGGRGGNISTVVVNNVVRGASGGGGQNMGLAQGSPDAQDLLNITTGNHLGIRGDAIPVATRQMSTAPVPWMYYSDFNFSGREGLVAAAAILLGQVNDITEFATGTGGAATVAPNASDRQSSADAGPGLCFIFYLKTNAFN